ncbi:hypothetical protein H2203_001013 [Taxawa tesnikishii (nom. ined.)]|nr:hypothetical protein H2203_001013 [Dothideales sp. JES 119]
MPDPSAVEDVHDTEELITRRANLNKRTVLKLDTILLPFLSILFLLNSLDRANVGSAESAHFTKDTGLPESALNTSLACFFAVFVALQPVGAALGRKYGMARYVPACMTLWGLCTTLHIFVRKEWQLISLRVLIGALEAGFYPTTVSYLSLFYTRYEFAKRLGLFYGQYAVAGALGGILSWAVFSHFPEPPAPAEPGTPPFTQSAAAAQHWHSWQVLFLLEGILTVAIALLGFLWLPHSADTAWFFTKAERQWAEERIRRDRDAPHSHSAHPKDASEATAETDIDAFDESRASVSYTEEGDRLLSSYTRSTPRTRRKSTASAHSLTADSGLSTSDVVSALLDWKIWYLLTCNILSAIPSTAFSVFLPS